MVGVQTDLRDKTERVLKCVLVGDAAIGKTSLIVSYTTNGYPNHYVPTAFDNYSVLVKVDNQPIRLQLCDTAGQAKFDSLRPFSYPDTDVFLLCFNVMLPTTLRSIMDHWLPEITRSSPQTPSKNCAINCASNLVMTITPQEITTDYILSLSHGDNIAFKRTIKIILVGTKCDLRSNVGVVINLSEKGEQPVSESKARLLSEELHADYLECSALTQQNLKQVFDAAILAALRSKTNLPHQPQVDKETKKSFFKQSFMRFVTMTKRLI